MTSDGVLGKITPPRKNDSFRKCLKMSSQPQVRGLSKLRFDVYEVDPRSGELHKHGYRVPLEDRPFRALLILLQQPPEVVTREELQKQLWAADVFIDFDHGLNKAIGKVRRALNDSVDKPRFVETVGRRGYGFIAPLITTDGREPDLVVKATPTMSEETHRGFGRAFGWWELPSLRFCCSPFCSGRQCQSPRSSRLCS